MDDVAAVHDQCMPGYIGRILRDQKSNHSRDFLNGSKAPHRNISRALFELARVAAREEAFGGDRTAVPEAIYL